MTAEALESLELDHGSGNLYRDLALPDPDLRQAKAVLAAAVITALDARGLTVREASAASGFAAADFSRVRNARLARFTLDRLIRMLQAVEPDARVSVQVEAPGPITSPSAPASAPP
jgi:predicted XRE-type DNA-binding protein